MGSPTAPPVTAPFTKVSALPSSAEAAPVPQGPVPVGQTAGESQTPRLPPASRPGAASAQPARAISREQVRWPPWQRPPASFAVSRLSRRRDPSRQFSPPGTPPTRIAVPVPPVPAADAGRLGLRDELRRDAGTRRALGLSRGDRADDRVGGAGRRLGPRLGRGVVRAAGSLGQVGEEGVGDALAVAVEPVGRLAHLPRADARTSVDAEPGRGAGAAGGPEPSSWATPGLAALQTPRSGTRSSFLRLARSERSPVMVPPTSTQSSRIFPPRISAFSSSLPLLAS